jgi:predicted metalloprotease with PDZ domain
MRHLYARFYEAKNRGFSEAEFKETLESFTGRNLDEFFEKYINGTEIPPYNDYLSPLGVAVNYVGVKKESSGLRVSESNGKVIVRYVRSGSAAEDAGISVNDEIIAINNYRMDKKMCDAFLGGLKIGEEVEILYSRMDELHTTTFEMKGHERPTFEYKLREDAEAKELYNYWLRQE